MLFEKIFGRKQHNIFKNQKDHLPESIRRHFRDREQFQQFQAKSIPERGFSNQSQLVDWLIKKSHWPYMRLHLEGCPYEAMLAEAKSLKELFISHRSDGIFENYTNHKWKSLCIHGISPVHTDWIDKYSDYADLSPEEVPWQWTDICDQCPVTYQYFKEKFPYDTYSRLRFMLLEPGGYIAPHYDRENRMLNPINIALNNPRNCYFKIGDYYMPWQEYGDAFLLDVSYPHAVWNNSSEDRYHIIVHGGAGGCWEDFNQMVYKSLGKNSLL